MAWIIHQRIVGPERLRPVDVQVEDVVLHVREDVERRGDCEQSPIVLHVGAACTEAAPNRTSEELKP
jgi:hypothetical protein